MSRKIKLLILLAVVMLAALLVYQFRFSHADALWKIVSQQCVPHMDRNITRNPVLRSIHKRVSWCLKIRMGHYSIY